MIFEQIKIDDWEKMRITCSNWRFFETLNTYNKNLKPIQLYLYQPPIPYPPNRQFESSPMEFLRQNYIIVVDFWSWFDLRYTDCIEWSGFVQRRQLVNCNILKSFSVKCCSENFVVFYEVIVCADICPFPVHVVLIFQRLDGNIPPFGVHHPFLIDRIGIWCLTNEIFWVSGLFFNRFRVGWMLDFWLFFLILVHCEERW